MPDAGAHGSPPTELAGPMKLADIANTSATMFAIGKPHTGSVFDERTWTSSTPLPVADPAEATLAARRD